MPEPETLLAQAFRVLRPHGWLAIYDGDYATATVATSAYDPLEVCVAVFRTQFVHDPWVIRKLPHLLRTAGFEIRPTQSHGYMEAGEGSYLLTWIDRGAEVLRRSSSISDDTAAALKAEARRRSAARQWFGHIAFASLLGQKPAA